MPKDRDVVCLPRTSLREELITKKFRPRDYSLIGRERLPVGGHRAKVSGGDDFRSDDAPINEGRPKVERLYQPQEGPAEGVHNRTELCFSDVAKTVVLYSVVALPPLTHRSEKR